MQISLFVIAIGAILLFVPATMWVGIALLGIGTVVYSLEKKTPLPSVMPRQRYTEAVGPMMSYPLPQQPFQQRAGFSASLKDQAEYEMGGNGLGKPQTPIGPYVKDDMLNLPIPVSPEIQEYVDLKYTKPLKGKNVRFEADRPGNPFIPGYDD